jgi:hypothetical protein
MFFISLLRPVYMVKEKEVKQTKNTTNTGLKYRICIRLTIESTELKKFMG